MRTLDFLLVALSLAPQGYSKPVASSPPLAERTLAKRCGPVQGFFNPTADAWDKINTQDWLNNWWNNNSASFSDHNNQGFAGTLGLRFLGEPNFLCQDNGGQSNNCDLNACDNRVLNDAGQDIEPAYYSLLSVQNLANHYQGLQEAYMDSSLFAALSAPNWATQFYLQQPPLNDLFFKELFAAVSVIAGIASALAGGIGTVAGIIGGTLATAAGGGATAFNLHVGANTPPANTAAADLGAALAKSFKAAIESFVNIQNDLMAGKTIDDNQGDIRSYISHGAYLNVTGVNVVETTNYFNTMVTSKAINALWSEQKVFIMGGGPCDDSGGIGSGPQEAKICRNNQAWYLYFWHEGNGHFLSESQYGYVTSPQGVNLLGSGDYQNVTVADILNSSLDAYNVAQFNYSSSTAQDRMESAIGQGWANPYDEGAAWEGTFTVPVCDVQWATKQDFLRQKQYVLQPYGSNSRPQWCGNVCTGRSDVTTAFLAAAHMDGFKSPTQACDGDQSTPVPSCNTGDAGATNNAMGAAIQSVDTSANFGFTKSGDGYTFESSCQSSSSKGDDYCCLAASGTDENGKTAYVTYTMHDSGNCGDSVVSNGTEVVSTAQMIQDTCTGGPPNSNSGRLTFGCETVGVSGGHC